MNAHTSFGGPYAAAVHPETQYLALLSDILKNGSERDDRTGVGTLGVFGRQIRFDLSAGFPVLTTKRLHWPSIVAELLWFLSGATNVKWLHDRGCTIWDEWADPETGELGPVYGKQWRSWSLPNGESIDQIARLIHGLRTNPNSRRHIVSAWNPAEVDQMALPPCHCLFQFFVADGRLSCQLYQRSADVFLGVPFNIASYALLTHLVAKAVGLEAGDFVHTFGDAHLYRNHIEQAERQLSREPLPFPRLEIDDDVDLSTFAPEDFAKFEPRQFRLVGYDPHPHIKAPGRGLSAPILTVGPVARARNGVIGREGGLPWRLSSDLKLFKSLTMGKPVIMGRKTWDSLPKKPLPGRLNLVLSRDGSFEPEGAVAVERFSEAVEIAREQAAEDGVEEVCVIGGAALFELALPKARRIYLTEVDAEVEGDVVFPAFDESQWREVRREAHAVGEGDDFGYVFRVLER